MIDQDLVENSSEWRMVPDLNSEEELFLRETLTASNDATVKVTSLGNADTLSIRRLGVSVNLRRLESLEQFSLKSSDWSAHRRNFYKFAINHVLTYAGICDYIGEISRIFGLAFAQGDWSEANQMLTKLHLVSKFHSKDTRHYKSVSDFHYTTLREELFRSCKSPPKTKTAKKFLQQLSRDFQTIENPISITPEEIEQHHKHYKTIDLDRHGFRGSTRLKRPTLGQLKSIENVADFLENKNDPSLIALSENELKILFPTRPLGEMEVSLIANHHIQDHERFARWMYAIRGYLKMSSQIETNSSTSSIKKEAIEQPSKIVSLKPEFKHSPIRIAVANFETSEGSWTSSAQRKPDLSMKRLSRLLGLVNEFLRKAKSESWEEKPLYFILPELSVPRKWLLPLASYFQRASISLIVGGEYETKKEGQVVNPAYLFLRTKQFGYPSTIILKQEKTQAALGEAAGLWRHKGAFIKETPESKICKSLPIYRHGNSHFGVILCSELTNVQIHHHYRGHVDAIFCLEWNQDVETFSSIVTASAQTIHAYIIQVNNRLYGDSRIRTPAKNRYNRDVVRILGGDHDYFVVGSIDVKKLRDFQKDKHSNSGDDAHFKPTPSGFDPDNYPNRLM